MSNITSSEINKLQDLIKQTIQTKGQQFPNPAVGAMVIRDEGIVSTGFHQQSGNAHAEIIAIDKAGQKNKGATLLITLEPCTHTGKTPPCVQKIIDSGIQRVIWAVNDPNPIVSGKAAKILRQKGITVIDNCLEAEGLEPIKEFYSFHKKKRPFIYVKAAVSLDGMIAPNSKQLTYISSKKSLKQVQELRKNCQAICVGSNTISIDQPTLSVQSKPIEAQPLIVVIDPQYSINQKWLFSTLEKGRHIILFTRHNIKLTHDHLSVVPLLTENYTSNWKLILKTLYKKNIYSVLIEGGVGVFSSLFTANYFDELWVFKVPQLLSSSESIPLVSPNLNQALDLSVKETKIFENDVLIMYNNNHAFSL